MGYSIWRSQVSVWSIPIFVLGCLPFTKNFRKFQWEEWYELFTIFTQKFQIVAPWRAWLDTSRHGRESQKAWN